MDSIINVLMTGAGAPGGPGIIRCLQQNKTIRLFTADADPDATGKYLSEHFLQIPKAGEPHFINTILELAKKHSVDVIFPLVTKELLLFAEHKESFLKENIRIIVSDFEQLSIANNKSVLYKYLQKHSILTPAFEVVNDLPSFEKALFKLGYPDKAVCFKPGISNGSRGFRVIDPAYDPYEILFSQKPSNTYTTFHSIIDTLKDKPFIELLVSEYLPGEEFTIDCMAADGESILTLPRKRIKMAEGISVKGQFIYQEEIISYCESIIKLLNLNGPIGIQVKKAEDGSFKILEINPRIQGTSVAAMGIGINLPEIAVLLSLQEKVTIEKSKIKWGTKFARYWQEVYHD